MARPDSPLVERRLAAILHADVQGYSRLIGEDEPTTLRILAAHLKLMHALARQYRGKAVGSRGDSLLAEFPSVVEAVQCAIAIQQELKGSNAAVPESRRVAFRIGISLGEIIEDGEQIHGEGINIAVRVETLAEAGGICISEIVYDQIKSRLPIECEDLGEHALKNIAKPVRVYRVLVDKANSEAIQQGFQRDTPPGRLSTLGKQHWRKAALAVVGLLLIAGTGLAIRSFFFRTPNTQPLPPNPQSALPLPDKPSIVVLPFVNMSGDPTQEYFSDGITEEITTALSKFPALFVIARSSAFTYKGEAVKIEKVGRELGVRYALEGSVRRTADRVRITAQLIDAITGHHLWADRYDRPLQDIFALQDEITQRILANLGLELFQAELERIKHTPTENLNAYDYYLRGWEYRDRLTQETNTQARQMWEKAVELDPQYAEAYAALGWIYHLEWIWQWNQALLTLEHALALGQQALALDNSLPEAHRLLSQVYLWRKQHEQAVAEAEKAIALNPNDTNSYLTLAGSGIQVMLASKC